MVKRSAGYLLHASGIDSGREGPLWKQWRMDRFSSAVKRDPGFAEPIKVAILFRLREEGQQDVAKVSRYVIRAEHLESVGKIDHFGDRRGFFQRVVSEGKGNSCHLAMEGGIGVRSAARDDLRFALWRRMLNANVEAAPSNWVSQAPLFVAGDDHEWNAFRIYGSKLGNRELEHGQRLEKHCLDRFFHLVYFVNEKYAGTFGFEGAHKRPRPEEITALKRLHYLLPTQALFF